MATTRAFRLPTSVTPESYDLHLSVDPDQERFTGTAKITLRVHEGVREVVLHGRGLEIDEADFVQDGEEIGGDVALDEETESIRVRPARPLNTGTARLEILFTGKVSKAMQGLYLARDAEERCLVTQCEATDARAVFPCFDEPAFKARLAWTVTAPAGQVVLTNGVLAERKPSEDQKSETWRFEETPPISSYLSGLAVGAFAATPEHVERGVPHRVWALGGKQRFGTHARDFAARCQSWYEDYFDVKYRFGAYDQLAVPSFAFGAMENPGLVVFRPSLVLVDPEEAAWRERKQVDRVVAHEAAHMWFGNHVTMQWWDDLWLNEAFAEWVAHKCLDALEPSHDIWLMFQGAADRAMGTDALAATHPIHVDVATPEEAQEIFDAITYGKGSAVMRMIEDFLGEEDFRTGLRSYMSEFGGANARGADLWRHLADASGKPVDRIMKEWVSRPGHPLVRARLQQGETPQVVLQQERAYVLERDGAGPGEEPWPVPVVLRYRDSEGIQETRHLLEQHEEAVPLPATGDVSWCVVNARDAGFYRVAPDAALLDGLAGSYVDLDPVERRGLLRDQWFMMKRGETEPKRFLDLLDAAIPQETHYGVTQDLVAYARGLERLLEQAGKVEALGDLRSWVVDRFSGPLKSVGLTTDPGEARKDPQGAERRAALFGAVAGVGMERDAVEKAHEIAALERQDPGQVDAEIAQSAVRLSLMHSGGDHFEVHLETYKKRRDEGMPPQLVERYLYTLPATRDDELVNRVIALCDDGTVPNQGVGPILRFMLVEPGAQEAAWHYVRDNWTKLKQTIGDAWCPILVEALGNLPPHLQADAQAFMDGLGTYASESSKRAREMLRLGVHVHERVVPGIVQWVEEKAP